MSDYLIIKHCSPTLAGIKCGSLFSCEYESRDELLKDIKRLNRLLVPKGLRVIPLRYGKERALIYVYRPRGLEAELSNEKALEILKQAGYESPSPDRCVIKLMSRLKENEDFPHEIGLFLSYPPEDVKGFIINKGKDAKLSGPWKVYGDQTYAQGRFNAYKTCTRIYCKRCLSGSGLDELTVADSALRR